MREFRVHIIAVFYNVTPTVIVRLNYECVVLWDLVKVFRAMIQFYFLLIPSYKVLSPDAEAVGFGNDFEVISSNADVRDVCFISTFQHGRK